MSLNKINNFLHSLGKKYYDQIPIDSIFDCVEQNGFTPVQEDGTKWSGFLCGSNGNASIELLGSSGKVAKYLNLSWYKMPSGRFEITAYVS